MRMIESAIWMPGLIFGRLSVIESLPERKRGSIVWRCRCDCGNETYATTAMLRNGHVKSCGCLQHEHKKKNTYEHKDGYVIGYDSAGRTFLFDEEDFDAVRKHYWYVDAQGYARTQWNKQQMKLHRYLMPDAKYIDHINHNPADNRRSNIRDCTLSENQHNRSLAKNNTSGHTGVRKRPDGWEANMRRKNSKRLYKWFKTYDEAVAQREAWEKEYGFL